MKFIIPLLFLILSSLMMACSKDIPKNRLQVKQTGIVDPQACIDKQSLSLTVYRPCEPAQVKALAIVIHGLNLKPEKMEPIIKKLVKSGIQVFNISLFGHGANYISKTGLTDSEARMESYKEVTYERWEQEAYGIYQDVKIEAVQRKLPVFLVGYSLGGLVGVNLLASKPDVQYNKMVLFAPALKIHLRSHLLKVLSPFPRFVIPSMSPVSYRANSGTSMAAYLALFQGMETLESHLSRKLNIPTLVFLDKNDELVSHKKTDKLVNDNHLKKWHIHEINNKNPIYHHLIIDEVSLGKENWNQICDSIINHLLQD